MKTSNRIHQKGAAKAAKSQAKTSPQVKAQPAVAVKKYCLSLLEWTPGDPLQPTCIDEIDVSALEYEILQKKSVVAGASMLRKELRKALDLMTTSNVFGLESATQQSNALLLLMAEALDGATSKNEGSHFLPGGGAGIGDEFICGLQHLVWSTQKRLNEAAEVAA